MGPMMEQTDALLDSFRPARLIRGNFHSRCAGHVVNVPAPIRQGCATVRFLFLCRARI